LPLSGLVVKVFEDDEAWYPKSSDHRTALSCRRVRAFAKDVMGVMILEASPPPGPAASSERAPQSVIYPRNQQAHQHQPFDQADETQRTLPFVALQWTDPAVDLDATVQSLVAIAPGTVTAVSAIP
jgi:hypothetical protein